MAKGDKCGETLVDGTPQPIPSDGLVKWVGHGGGGFTHVGPCEVYIDDKMVAHGDNCEDEFKGGAAGTTQASDIPVDFSSCNGKCTLTIYWLAFQNEQWQAYINCVPLQGSGSSTNTQTAASSTGENKSVEASKAASQANEANQGNDENQASKDNQENDENNETQGSGENEEENQGAKDNQENQESKEGDGNQGSKDNQEDQENQENQTPAATTQAAQTPATQAETKCKAPARRLRKKLATLGADATSSV